MLKTFQGGIHPPTSKDFTVDKAIKAAPLPKRVIIPLLQHTGSPCEPLVEVGSYVRTGQVIGKSDKYISSPVHASISGKVISIKESPHPVIGSFKAVTIEGDGKDELDPSITTRDKVNLLSQQQIRDIIRDAGIVGLGGAAFPAYVKLTPPENKLIDSVILNGAECEPYLTCDHRLMVEKPVEVIEGLKIIMKLTKTSCAYIGIESNKLSAIFALEKVLSEKKPYDMNIRIVVLKTKYPQGAEKSLIKSILHREVPPGGLPFDVGCIVSNVGTAFAIYEAIYKNKPLYERVLTVSGAPIREPSNLLVRIGTSARELVDICGGFCNRPKKIIFGGPMMGLTQYTLDLPVIKGTSGIIFLADGDIEKCREEPCIRCAKCVDVCPMNLIPTDIVRLVKRGMYQALNKYNISDCIECGCCSYECPSKIPVFQWIKIGKIEVSRKKYM